MHKRSAFICLLAAILIAWFCIHLDTTPNRINADPADSAFSEPRAMARLREIAKAPHSIGTPENAAVRNHIAGICAKLGLDTSIQQATTVSRVRWGIVAARVFNVVARLKGTNPGTTLLIAAHYDSQPNAVGAGDDGSGCAAMLETIRALKAGTPLKNDVIFLFTDGEEEGLLGAEAFVRDNPLLKEVGMMLNFDARCNAGPPVVAETNEGNGWVIDGYARSQGHHNASSLNYEIYKLLPNSTDYTPFKAAGIPGLNSAVIDGFVHYHSMTDIPANFDARSLQEEGDNMLAGARYFGNCDLRDTKSPDHTYFNIIGGWFVHYPAGLNIYFLILTNLLLIIGLVIGFRAKQVRFRGLLTGLIALPLTLLILYFLSSWTLGAIRSAEPLYLRYYSNAYHPYYFYFALAALAITVFTLIWRWLLSRFSMPSLLAGASILLVVLLDGLYLLIPTAIFFLCFPLLILLAGGIFSFFHRAGSPATPVARSLSTSPFTALVLLMPALLFLAPMCFLFFVVFDLQPQAAVVPALIALPMTFALPLLSIVLRETRGWLPAGAFTGFVLSLVLGLVLNTHSPEYPIKSNLTYIVDADSSKAHWVSLTPASDHWNKQFLPQGRKVSPETIVPGGIYNLPEILINDAPLVDSPAPVVGQHEPQKAGEFDPSITIRYDSIAGDRRFLSLHIQAQGANSVEIRSDTDIKDILVDGRESLNPGSPKAQAATPYRWFEYFGIPPEGFDLTLQLDRGSKGTLSTITRYIGLPRLQGFDGFPAGIIPGPETYSNASFVIKRIALQNRLK
jgi:hypothetical protein